MVDLLGSSVRSDALRSVLAPLKRCSSLLLSGEGFFQKKIRPKAFQF